MEKELKFVRTVAEDVKQLGGNVYFVGGYVRDKILHKQNKDIDVEVYGLTMEELAEVLGKYGAVMEVGATFGVLMVKGYDIDFALPRTETKVGDKHTDFDVVVNSDLSLLEATKRRDFTMNAILQDVLTEQYIDLYGGIADIKGKVIRYVNAETFKEDELRAFRACQFASRFGFKIDPTVISISKGFNYNLSKERIYEEVNKAMMKSDKPSIAFNYMYEMGIVDKLFPELGALKGCEQSPLSHPEGDVWNHTMMVVDHATTLKNKSSNSVAYMYTALCHDMGKPQSRMVTEDGKITFYNHEFLGVSIAETFMRRLTKDKKNIQYIKTYTEYHMMGHKIGEIKDSTLRKLLVNVDINELMLIAEADSNGKGLDGRDYAEIRGQYVKRIKEVSHGEFGKVVPFFTGKDLKELGYTEGEELGKALKEAYQNQLNGQTKEHIYTYLKNKKAPKKKVRQISDVVDEEIEELLKKDTLEIELAQKRIGMFKRLTETQKLKVQQTTNRVPYSVVITKDRKSKYVFTPIMVLQLSLDNQQSRILMDTKNHTIQERKSRLTHIMGSIEDKYVQRFDIYKECFGRLTVNKTN